METIKYATGRDYGMPQVLEIHFTPTDDCMVDVPATFTDASRGISGTVKVFGFCANRQDIGKAVLAEYDAGRYI